MYNTSPLSGWIGEEDEGQLSALYVMMAMGLFKMYGGASIDPYYDLSSPLFERVTIHLDSQYYSGKDFTIEAHGNAPENVYIQAARLNGKSLNRAWIKHSEIVRGGKLELEMGPEPNTAWANGAGPRCRLITRSHAMSAVMLHVTGDQQNPNHCPIDARRMECGGGASCRPE